MKYDVAIIGGGIAGLSAAMYCGRFNLKTVIFSPLPGGTIQLTDVVENYPGFKSISGPNLAKQFIEHAKVHKPTWIRKKVRKISKQKGGFGLLADKRYSASAVILTTGTAWRRLEVPGAKEYENKGVHFCANCDGPRYKSKVVGVVGGADSAVKEALVLSGMAKKVNIIYRGKQVHPEPINMLRLKKKKNVGVLNETKVVEIFGGKSVEGVKLDNGESLALDAVFVEIGHIPLTELAAQLKVRLNKTGQVKVNTLMETNVKGFFAAGDVTNTPFKQGIVAASEGSVAAYSAYGYLTR